MRDGLIPYATLVVGANPIDIEIVVENHNNEQVFQMVVDHEEGRLLAYTVTRLVEDAMIFGYAKVVVSPAMLKSVCWRAKFYHERKRHDWGES
jgi:hypothetical protein